MDDMIELAQRLEFYADTGDMGRKPDPSSITRRSAKALREAAAEIEQLRSQLAARDGEIAEWLRGEAAKVIGVITSSDDYDTAKAELKADIIETAADMIERGKYRDT